MSVCSLTDLDLTYLLQIVQVKSESIVSENDPYALVFRS